MTRSVREGGDPRWEELVEPWGNDCRMTTSLSLLFLCLTLADDRGGFKHATAKVNLTSSVRKSGEE